MNGHINFQTDALDIEFPVETRLDDAIEEERDLGACRVFSAHVAEFNLDIPHFLF